MKKIKLTQGKFALVDDLDYEWLNQWKWYAHKQGNTFYAVSYGVKMHRLILGLTKPNEISDHKDRNGLNNQRSNLRIATRSQNMANCRSKKNSSSKYLGVSWCNLKKKWVAGITKNWKRKTIGYFNSERDAAIAYNKEAIKVHGSFANINITT